MNGCRCATRHHLIRGLAFDDTFVQALVRLSINDVALARGDMAVLLAIDHLPLNFGQIARNVERARGGANGCR